MLLKKQIVIASLLSLTVVVSTFNLVAYAHSGDNLIAQSTDLGAQAYDQAESVFENSTDVHYEHLHRPAKEQVYDTGSGHCASTNDCSGFISYVLATVAAKHYRVIRQMQPRSRYPQAKTYARFFAQLSATQPDYGWLTVGRVFDLRRGDIIAWEKGSLNSDHGGHGNSGHVMMVIDSPSVATQTTVNGESIRYVSIHVIDSSSVYHFPPQELPPLAHQAHRDGLGKGYIRLILDNEDNPIGYWEGTYWGEGGKNIGKPAQSTMIHFGRLVPM